MAIIIRARRLPKEKGLSPDTNVKTLCSQVGLSRKTGSQWEKRLDQMSRNNPTQEELARLKAEHEKLKQAYGAELREAGIDLSSRTIEAILIANDLHNARTRKKRPAFYQSLCQKFPNGLLSIDGSELVVWLGDTAYP